MDTALIAMNDEANRLGSERLLTQMREEGLVYRLWVTGTSKGSRLHMQVNGLDADLEHRLVRVLRGRGMQLDIQPLTP
ncbi:hypothetical protein [Methylobacterium marchantiae]|uniref:Uncharacterized protein n=1 Tax=Methylobacterium marchantiae TaxID=600331 RepID=A0ABW3X072_9HYPH|nr:hypothetical protein AIGOOFII_1716 [Methylobacterium marchantiae]